MGILTEDMQRVVREQKLGFAATVCPDGTPSLSPKGTTIAWDDQHLVFADIHSPGTINNLLNNPAIEINVVDIFARKGYRFKGVAEVLSNGKIFEEIISEYKKAGSKHTIKNIVFVRVDRILPVISPAYDTQPSEEEITNKWIDYWSNIHKK